MNVPGGLSRPLPPIGVTPWSLEALAAGCQRRRSYLWLLVAFVCLLLILVALSIAFLPLTAAQDCWQRSQCELAPDPPA